MRNAPTRSRRAAYALAGLVLLTLSVSTGCAGVDRGPSGSVVETPATPVRAGSLLSAGVTASTTDYAESSPWRVVDGSGISGDADGRLVHDADPTGGSMWRSVAGVTGKIFLEFDLGTSYPVDRMEIWNYNARGAEAIGLRDVGIFYSIGGVSWTELRGSGYPYRFAPAPGNGPTTATNLDDEDASPVNFSDAQLRYVRIVVEAKPGLGNWGGGPANSRQFGLSEVRFYAGNGAVVSSEHEWDELFDRRNGWVGADGIFSIPADGVDRYTRAGARDTVLLFSDTFIGSVDLSGRRRGNHMINNSIAMLSGVTPDPSRIQFVWGIDGSYSLDSVFSPVYPDPPLVGSAPVHLVDGSGLSFEPGVGIGHQSGSPETMWLSSENPGSTVSVELDLQARYRISEMEIWNYNEHASYRPDLHLRGLKEITIEHASTAGRWRELTGPGYPYRLAPMSGGVSETASNLDDGFSTPIDFGGVEARYVRITARAEPGIGNWGGSGGDDDRYGLSEVLLRDIDGRALYATVSASSVEKTRSPQARSSRYWLQDGVAIDGTLYLLPLLIQDSPGGAAGFSFAVRGVHAISIPMVDGRPSPGAAEYRGTPLFYHDEETGVERIFGAGIFDNNREAGAVDPDGYIYIYGYTSAGEYKNLLVSRVARSDFLNFNEWRYWDGAGWSVLIADAAVIARGVSPELSVSQSDFLDGRYVLVYMKDTLSGIICYATADSPTGPFEAPVEVYRTPEPQADPEVFTYNAKAHPHLSPPGELLVSYHVNSRDTSAFDDASIYRPRFISFRETVSGE